MPSTALEEATPDRTAPSEDKEGDDDDNEDVGGEETADVEASSLTTKKFCKNFDEWNEEVMKDLLEARGTNPISYEPLKMESQN